MLVCPGATAPSRLPRAPPQRSRSRYLTLLPSRGKRGEQWQAEAGISPSAPSSELVLKPTHSRGKVAPSPGWIKHQFHTARGEAMQVTLGCRNEPVKGEVHIPQRRPFNFAPHQHLPEKRPMSPPHRAHPRAASRSCAQVCSPTGLSWGCSKPQTPSQAPLLWREHVSQQASGQGAHCPAPKPTLVCERRHLTEAACDSRRDLGM